MSDTFAELLALMSRGQESPPGPGPAGAGQLSKGLVTMAPSTSSVNWSLSSSVSQASPDASPGRGAPKSIAPAALRDASVLLWPVLGVAGQLSVPVQGPGPPLGAPGSQTPSPSASTSAWEQPPASTGAEGAVPGQRSDPSLTQSPSASTQATGPVWLELLRGWFPASLVLTML